MKYLITGSILCVSERDKNREREAEEATRKREQDRIPLNMNKIPKLGF